MLDIYAMPQYICPNAVNSGKFHKQPVPPRHSLAVSRRVALPTRQRLPSLPMHVRIVLSKYRFFLSWFLDWVCGGGGGDFAFCDVVTKIKLHIKSSNRIAFQEN